MLLNYARRLYSASAKELIKAEVPQNIAKVAS
jgi:hypothetical protein